MHPHVTDCHHSFSIYIYFLAGTAADARSNTPKSPPEGENKGTK